MLRSSNHGSSETNGSPVSTTSRYSSKSPSSRCDG